MIELLLSMGRVVVIAVSVACVVPIRRLVRGPLRPSWSLRYELVAMFIQGAAALMLPLPALRRMTDWLGRLLPYPMWVPRQDVSVQGVSCSWFGEPSEDVVLYLHGGAYVLGSPVLYRDAMARLARKSHARVIAPEYRLAPEHPHPAALEDALTVYTWLLRDCGIAPGRVVLAGDSAGAGLALSLLTHLRDSGESLPRGAIFVSPWADVEGSGDSQLSNACWDWVPEGSQALFGQMYAGRYGTRHPAVSPLYAELSGLPPILVMVGGAERLLDIGRSLAARIASSGGQVTLEVVEDMVHVWILFAPVISEARESLSRMGQWVRESGDASVS